MHSMRIAYQLKALDHNKTRSAAQHGSVDKTMKVRMVPNEERELH